MEGIVNQYDVLPFVLGVFLGVVSSFVCKMLEPQQAKYYALVTPLVPFVVSGIAYFWVNSIFDVQNPGISFVFTVSAAWTLTSGIFQVLTQNQKK